MKIFFDAVHGQIHVPKEYCKHIIDTIHFQRLRRIEQTSMRDLYPSAHHDRFIHSLGTYCVGAKMFEQVYLSIKKRFDNIHPKDELYNDIKRITLVCENGNKDTWTSLRKTFELACLLHDCGHAPFSHTFEDYFFKNKIDICNDIIESCNGYLSNNPERKRIVDDFGDDLRKHYSKAKSHELVSAWLVLNKDGFGNALYKLGADPLLMARMITGCTFTKKIDNHWEEKDILNCFIKLLNGHEIDADRLDYTLRDKWASGLNSVNINLFRLISSLSLFKDSTGCFICFKKQALPELQGLIETKNYNSFWVFKHHKTEYRQELLLKAVEKLASVFSGDTHIKKYLSLKKKKNEGGFQNEEEEEAENSLLKGEINSKLYEILSYKNLLYPLPLSFKLDGNVRKESIYLTCDDDIVYLLKKYFCTESYENEEIVDFFNIDNYAKEWLARERRFIPIWKSYSELKAKYISKYTELSNLNFIINLFDRIDENKAKIMECLENDKFFFCGKVKISGLFKELISEKTIDNYNRKREQLIKNLNYILQTIYIDKMQSNFKSLFSNIFAQIEETDAYELDHKIVKDIALNIDLKEIEPDALHICMGNDRCCFTSLDLPKKNQEKKYNFFYLFAPKIYYKNNKIEVDDTIYNRYYTEEFQKAIKSISFADQEVLLI